MLDRTDDRRNIGSPLSPIVAILIAAVLLGEPIEPAVIAGPALVIVGVWLDALRSTTPG
jgi:drug/metabolite transporter (DMT)-like permease